MTREEAIKVCIREKECVQAALNSCADGNGYVSPDGMIRASDYVEAVDMAIAALREQESAENAHCNCCKKGNSWISVEERLPEKYTLVLCYKDNQWRLGYYIGAEYGKGVAAFRHPRDQFAFGVTHWMPLPEAPKEEV